MATTEDPIFVENDDSSSSQAEIPASVTSRNWQETQRPEFSNTWNRLGLSTLASPALRHLLKQPDNAVDDDRHEIKVQDEDQINYHRNYLREVNVLDTFLSYKWVLQALMRRAVGSDAGCQIKVADVLLFEAGEPAQWVYTNRAGRVKFRQLKCDSIQQWERFLKAAFQAAFVSKEDISTPVCTKFSWGIEGVVGEHMNAQQFRDFARTDSMNRFQVAGVQVLVGPKCGNNKIPSRKSILYKTEFRKDCLKGGSFKHTKEYDVHETVWDSHMSNVAVQGDNARNTTQRPPAATGLKPVASSDVSENLESDNQHSEARQGNSSVIPTLPWMIRKEVLASKSSNRALLSDLTETVIRYIERSRGLTLQTLRCHFVVDCHEKVWLVGASKVLPVHHKTVAAEEDDEGDAQDPIQEQQVQDEPTLPMHIEECMNALKVPTNLRKPAHIQAIFDYIRGCHFLSNISPVFLNKLCHSMEYKFVERGVEVYYAGDPCDEMYVVLSGSLRSLGEPFNTIYCRTVDLSAKDTFAEQAITRPGSQMQSQVITTDDSHLIIIKQQKLEQVLDPGRKNPHRWHIKKSQLERCRKIFSTATKERNESDLKMAVASTAQIYFFQNIPGKVHHEMCRVAQYRRFLKDDALFDLPFSDPEVSEKSSLLFYIIMRGEVKWEYQGRNQERQVSTVLEGDHVLSVGRSSVVSECPCEVLIIKVSDWESYAKDFVPVKIVRTTQASELTGNGGTFLTELQFIEPESIVKSLAKSRQASVSTFQPLKHLDRQKERHLTCGVTGEKFPASQQRCLRFRQIRDAALHLKKRQVQLAGFDRDIWLNEPACRLRLHDTMIVSPSAYNTFVAEKNMEDQEKLFARVVLQSTAPRVADRVLPPAGCTKATSRLLLSGMFFELASVESPKSLAKFGSKFELRFRLCEEAAQIRFEISSENLPKGSGALKVDQVRMSWFFCADEGINLYLKERGSVEFELVECSLNKVIAKVVINLSDVADRVALHQSFKVSVVPADQCLADQLALQFVCLNINIGCIRFREVDASNFRLRRRHGLYFPSTPFITECLPCDGWDPCNEEYIQELINGFIEETDGTVLSTDGKLIPRGRLGHELISEERKCWANPSKDNMADASGSAPKERLVPLWKRANVGQARTVLALRRDPSSHSGTASAPPRSLHQACQRPQSAAERRRTSICESSTTTSSTFSQEQRSQIRLQGKLRPSSAVERNQPEVRFKLKRPESAPPIIGNRTCIPGTDRGLSTLADMNSRSGPPKGGQERQIREAFIENNKSGGHSSIGRDRDQTASTELGSCSPKASMLLQTTGVSCTATRDEGKRGSHRRPASAMSRISTCQDDGNLYAASLLATMTRPSSALQRPTAKCVEGLGNAVPSFQSACQVSKMLSIAAAKSSKMKSMSSALESCHHSWRSNLISMVTLEQDLKSLDTRTNLVSVRDKAAW